MHFWSYIVSKLSKADSGIFFEPHGDIGVEPAAPVFEGLGQVPVVESDGGRDAAGLEGGQEVLVILHAGLIHCSSCPVRKGSCCSIGKDPGPGDGEPA